jgi:glycosyltransferase involved in cell wall biosynthesis
LHPALDVLGYSGNQETIQAKRLFIARPQRIASIMRITFLNSLYPPHGASGAENTLRFLAAALASRGHVCTVVTLTPEQPDNIDEVDGIAVHYLSLANVYWPHGGHRPRALRPVFQAVDAFNPVMARRLGKALGTLAPDVLNCHNLQGFSAAAWFSAARLGIPIVQSIHDYYLACPRSAMWRPGRGNCAAPCAECRAFSLTRRSLSRLPAAVTCVSHRVFDRLTAAGAFPRARRGTQPVRIIRGNNPASVAFASEREDGTDLTLGFMGRLEPSKGLEGLLDAITELPEIELLVAGKGEPSYEALLRNRAANCRRVHFLGHIKPADFFPRVDLLAIPSVWEDPFPRVFHEALAYGVPSLVTPLGGLPEVIRPWQTGFIAGGSDAAALGSALRTLLTRGWDRAAMRAECRAAAAAYRPERIVAQYEAVLTAAATRRPVPEDAGEVWHPSTDIDSAGLEVIRHGA